jgi:hypothetical protein
MNWQKRPILLAVLAEKVSAYQRCHVPSKKTLLPLQRSVRSEGDELELAQTPNENWARLFMLSKLLLSTR